MRLHPFRALRPPPAIAGEVAAVPYDVVNREEAAALAAGNPRSFLHVGRPDIDLPADTDAYDARVYAQGRAALDAFLADGTLVRDAEPALYLYRLKMGDHIQTGVAGTWSVDEYEKDLIKKHEKTRRDKEDDRTHHMCALRAQTGKVFLTYKASVKVDAIVAQALAVR